jgi:hypothetical protein
MTISTVRCDMFSVLDTTKGKGPAVTAAALELSAHLVRVT